jgi:hypothetical protein
VGGWRLELVKFEVCVGLRPSNLLSCSIVAIRPQLALLV